MSEITTVHDLVAELHRVADHDRRAAEECGTARSATGIALQSILDRYKVPKSVPKRAKRGPSAGKDFWRTPPELHDLIRAVLGGPIDLDPCASPDKQRHFAAENMSAAGLDVQWVGRVFVNPPYSDTKAWVAKAAEEWASGRLDGVVMLIPPSVDTAYWSRYLLPMPEAGGANVYATAVGRLAFHDDNGPVKGNTKGSALVGWVSHPEQAAEALREAGWNVHRPIPSSTKTVHGAQGDPATA